MRLAYNLKDFPEHLQKKVTLLMHFKSFMEGKKEEIRIPPGAPSKALSVPVYVKKWMKTKHAILFRLSNKVVQVNFTDNTELVMSSTSKKVSYLSKKGERFNFMLQHALESDNQEMIKRLNYAR